MSDTQNSRGAEVAPARFQFGKGLRTAVLAGLAVLATPIAANAACEIPEDYRDPFATGENGRLDLIDKPLKGTYDSLNKVGIDVGGAYVAEPFYAWGGLNDGG